MSVLTLGRGPALVMAPARAMAEVDAAAAAGADLVEVPGDARLVAAVRAAYPELVIAVRAGAEGAALDCCAAGADLLTGGTFGEVAARFEVGFAGSAALVARAVRAGVGPSRVLVEGSGAAAGSAGSAGSAGAVAGAGVAALRGPAGLGPGAGGRARVAGGAGVPGSGGGAGPGDAAGAAHGRGDPRRCAAC